MDPLHPAARIALAVRRRHDHRAAGAEQAEDVEDRQIECQRRDPEHAVGGADRETIGQVGERVARGAMGDGDALGHSGAARRVDHVGHVVGRRGLRQARGRRAVRCLARNRPGRRCRRLHAREWARRYSLVRRRFVVSERDAHAGLAQDRGDAVRRGWSALIGRNARPGLEDGQRGDDLLDALLHDDGDQLVGRLQHRLQLMREHAGAVRELAESERARRR